MIKRHNDDGYATVAAAGIIVAIVAVSLSLMGVASHVVARHQGQLASHPARQHRRPRKPTMPPWIRAGPITATCWWR